MNIPRPQPKHAATGNPAWETGRAASGVSFVLTALCIGSFVFGTAEFSMMSFLPQIARDLHVSEPRAGLLVSFYALGVMIGAPLITVLSATIPKRCLLILLVVWFAVANAISAIGDSFGQLAALRFAAGMPHGAYLGLAALVAAAQVAPQRKAWAVSRVFLGLTIATFVGVPLASWLSQALNWRSALWLVSFLAVVSAAMLAMAGGRQATGGVRPSQELRTLINPQVWLTLAIGAIGFGGMFCVYAYLASTLLQVTGIGQRFVPLYFAIFGIGMTLGNIVAPSFADRAPLWSAGGVLLWSLAVLLIYPFVAQSAFWIGVDVLLIGGNQALGVVLQTRLMDVSGEAQALPAALNHSAFNVANAIGPAMGGLAISHGMSWTATGPVGAGLAGSGILVWLLSIRLNRRAALRNLG